jgi:hypothetical protein
MTAMVRKRDFKVGDSIVRENGRWRLATSEDDPKKIWKVDEYDEEISSTISN